MSKEKDVQVIKDKLLKKKRRTGTDEYLLSCLYKVHVLHQKLSGDDAENMKRLLDAKLREMRVENELKRARAAYEQTGRRLVASDLDAMSASKSLIDSVAIYIALDEKKHAHALAAARAARTESDADVAAADAALRAAQAVEHQLHQQHQRQQQQGQHEQQHQRQQQQGQHEQQHQGQQQHEL